MQAFGPSMMPTIDSRPDGTFCFVDMTAAWRGFKAGASPCPRSWPLLCAMPRRPALHLVCTRSGAHRAAVVLTHGGHVVHATFTPQSSRSQHADSVLLQATLCWHISPTGLARSSASA